jgi:geranylgeranyl reductase family protein
MSVSEQRRFDVGIVGAGPAGAWAAVRLARAGARVVVVDGSHPREKPCGGGLTGRALEVVSGEVPANAFDGVTIDAASFEHRSQRAVVRLESGEHPALTVSPRRAFDAALLARAVSAGATHLAHRAIDVVRTPGGWRIATRATDVEASWLIGADGPGSLVRRRVFRPFGRADLSIASGFFAHGASSTTIDIAFEDAPPGYLWSFPRRDHLAVGVCAAADVCTTTDLQRLAHDWFARTGITSARLERYNWPIPTLSEEALAAERPSGDRWMLLGDAAGLVDPITREGIFFALRSADMAAQSLGTGRPGQMFSEHLTDEIHEELRCAARLRTRFFRPHFIALLLRALGTSGSIRDVMADLVAGRQMYRGLRRRLLTTMEWRLMLDLCRNRAA